MCLLSGGEGIHNIFLLLFIHYFIHRGVLTAFLQLHVFPISFQTHLKCIVNLQTFVICSFRAIGISVFVCFNYVHSIYCSFFFFFFFLCRFLCVYFLGYMREEKSLICRRLLSPPCSLMEVALIIASWWVTLSSFLASVLSLHFLIQLL